MIHTTAIIDESVIIPDSTNVWAFTHISKGAKIGNDCTIGEGVHIGNNVIIGDRCRIQNHALIYDGVEIGSDVLIAPGVVTTNDYFPELPVGDWSKRFKKTIIKDKVSIGANATIVCGVTLNENCMIGAGAVVTKDVFKDEVKVGNPAKHLRWK